MKWVSNARPLSFGAILPLTNLNQQNTFGGLPNIIDTLPNLCKQMCMHYDVYDALQKLDDLGDHEAKTILASKRDSVQHADTWPRCHIVDVDDFPVDSCWCVMFRITTKPDVVRALNLTFRVPCQIAAIGTTVNPLAISNGNSHVLIPSDDAEERERAREIVMLDVGRIKNLDPDSDIDEQLIASGFWKWFE